MTGKKYSLEIDKSKNYYHWDEENIKSYKNKMGFYKTNREWSFILKNINNHLSLETYVLDIGGGSGRFAKRLVQKGHNVLIVDSNITAIELAKERGLDAVCANFMDDFYTDQKYNCILCIEVLLYIENKNLFFEKITKLLTPDGIIIFTATNPSSWRYWLRNFKRNRFNYYEQSLKNYKQMLSSNQLELLECKGFMWLPFSLSSNSALIPYFAFLERHLFLGKIIFQSPWWLFVAKKNPK